MLLDTAFARKINSLRQRAIKKMIFLAKINGNETILDLGTGSGIVAINIAKNLKNGKVYGIDQWKLFRNLKLIFTMFLGNSKKRAIKNARIEKVSDKCIFIESSFKEKLNFPDNYFDIICSSQSLYYIDSYEQLKNTFLQINRVLKENGKIILFEPKECLSWWNIKELKAFFKEFEYEIDNYAIQTPNRWGKQCILYGKKRKKS